MTETPLPGIAGTGPDPRFVASHLPLDEDRQAALELWDALLGDAYYEIKLNGPTTILGRGAEGTVTLPGVAFSSTEVYHWVIDELILPWCDTPDRTHTTRSLLEGKLRVPGPSDAHPALRARVHCMLPPAVPHAIVTIAKAARGGMSIADLITAGSMSPQMAAFLGIASQARLAMMLSGVSGAGKTTTLQALAAFWSPTDRVVLIEDTPELELPGVDVVAMCSSVRRPGTPPEELVTMDWLVAAANRMRPDRIIVGEVRGAEMRDWLDAANSGADGSMITVHAADARRALEKAITLASRSAGAPSEMTLRRELASSVEIVIHLAPVNGVKRIVEILEVSDTVATSSGQIAAQQLFVFDRQLGRHRGVMPPSDRLRAELARRGHAVDLAWWQS